MTALEFQPVAVAINDDHEGRLVFVDGTLVALLVQLSDIHGEHQGAWFLEAGFGNATSINPPVFPDLDSAGSWVLDRLRASL